MKKAVFLFLLFNLLQTSCTKEHDIINIDEEPFTPITFIETQSLVISIVDKMHFSCVINGQRYVSQQPGFLIIENLTLEKGENPV